MWVHSSMPAPTHMEGGDGGAHLPLSLCLDLPCTVYHLNLILCTRMAAVHPVGLVSHGLCFTFPLIPMLSLHVLSGCSEGEHLTT